MKIYKNNENTSVTEAAADWDNLKAWLWQYPSLREGAIDLFKKMKDRLKPEERDLYYWIKNKQPDDFIYRMNELETDISNSQKKKVAAKGAELVAENDDWKVYKIKSHDASCLFGKDTKWCITMNTNDYYWNHYLQDGYRFYFFIRKNPKGDNWDKIALQWDDDAGTDVAFWDAKDDDHTFLDPDLGVPEKFDGVSISGSISNYERYVNYHVKKSNQNEKIPDDARQYVEYVIIHQDVEFLKSGMFHDCTKLRTIRFDNRLITEIPIECFARCSSLETIDIPRTVKAIGPQAFVNCIELYNVDIPLHNGRLTDIDQQVFMGCEKLKDMDLPDSISFIGSDAFLGCTAFKHGYNFCPMTSNEWKKNVFVAKGNEDMTKYLLLEDNTRVSDITADESIKRLRMSTESINVEALEQQAEVPADESLQSVYDQYYGNIDYPNFLEIISLDPTFKESQDKLGTYGKWLLKLYQTNKLNNPGHIPDVLKRFEENKKNLKNKDIMTYKTVEDLDNALNDDNSYTELSSRQRLRQTQKAVRSSDLGKDAELAYSDGLWEIWIPKTYEASCKLGQGSSWCTASTSDDYYYQNYTSKGPLYILKNLKDPDKMYQFHFETGSFMDREDRPINITTFLRDSVTEGVADFFYDKIAKSLGIKNLDEKIEIGIDESDFDQLKYYNFYQTDAPRFEEFKNMIFHPELAVEDWDYPVDTTMFSEYFLEELPGEIRQQLFHLTDSEDFDEFPVEVQAAFDTAYFNASISAAEEIVRRWALETFFDALPNHLSGAFNQDLNELEVEALGSEYVKAYLELYEDSMELIDGKTPEEKLKQVVLYSGADNMRFYMRELEDKSSAAFDYDVFIQVLSEELSEL